MRNLDALLTYENILRSHINAEDKWLDLGCGHNILPPWRSDIEKYITKHCCKMVVGIDYDIDSLKKHENISYKIRGNISELPFKDNSFDIVTANMVLEHVMDPESTFKEINRILKPHGIFIFHTPNIYGYKAILSRIIPDKMKRKLIFFLEGRKEEDVFKTYYRINNKRKIYYISNLSHFQIIEIRMCFSSLEFLFIPPLAAIELLWIRILLKKYLENFRTNIIAILRKL